jgi:hypothetical protein
MYVYGQPMWCPQTGIYSRKASYTGGELARGMSTRGRRAAANQDRHRVGKPGKQAHSSPGEVNARLFVHRVLGSGGNVIRVQRYGREVQWRRKREGEREGERERGRV